jgi:hypothetical protein
MATQAKYDGKTSVWFYKSTKVALDPFKVAGETWDGFMLRVMVELRKKNRTLDVDGKLDFGEDKITTVWLNKTTVTELNTFRRTNENWGKFFDRIGAVLKNRKLKTNSNDRPPA